MSFTYLAQQIVNSNDQTAYAQMLYIICDSGNLQKILNQIPHSDVLHFVYTQLLGKSILSGQFCPINQTKSDDNTMKQNQNQKVKLYSTIIPRVFQNVCYGNYDKKQYIVNSAVNTISICLKDLCDNSKNVSIFSNILSTVLFPSFKVNEYFTSSLNAELVFLEPSQSVMNYFLSNKKSLEMFKISAKIMIQLIDYITMVTVYKTYYEYRRNIYTFRNTYLATILNVGAEYHKILHLQWKKNISNHQIINAMTVSIQLVQKLIAYPFSLTLHEFQSEDESKDNIVGIGSQIYFPSYYRNVLCDNYFLDTICEFYLFLVKQLNTVNQLGQTLYSLVRILGRIISASAYTFNSQEQRKTFRGYCSDLVLSMLFNFKFYDSFYIDLLSDIFCKVINTYTPIDYQERKEKIYQGVIYFCESLIVNCKITLDDGKRNPFNRAFDIINLTIADVKQSILSDKIYQKSQEILQKAFVRLHDWQQTERIMNEFGKNKFNEIQCFQELFENIPATFSVNLDKNLNILRSLEIQKFSDSQQTVWLHLCSILLPNHLATRDQTEIILKFFKVAKNGNTMACLHYIQVLVKQVLFEMDNGSPTTPLWSYIAQIQGCSFSDFMLYVIRVCKKNFQQVNTDIIDYALQVFKSIYMRLRKHSNQSSNINLAQKFDPYYDEVKQLIGNLTSTVFENPKFFKRRVQLFNVISTIWINTQNYRYLQQIYNLISASIKKQIQMAQQSINQNKQYKVNAMYLLKYFHDVRGLLQPIQEHQSFKIICQLTLMDLSRILPLAFFSREAIQSYFSEQVFLKAFCKMVLQFVSDYGKRITFHVQTELPFLIYDMFHPYLTEAAKFDYPKTLIQVWCKFSALNPLKEMLPLVPTFKQKQSKQFPSLIKEYFENIHRVQLSQLQSLYPYIQDKIEYLCQWWEQVIRRKLYPNVSLVQVVQSRIATTKRQKEELAKLLFLVGNYDSRYWNLQGYNDERQFVKIFLENYK